jgi:hypothetical protein
MRIKYLLLLLPFPLFGLAQTANISGVVTYFLMTT